MKIVIICIITRVVAAINYKTFINRKNNDEFTRHSSLTCKTYNAYPISDMKCACNEQDFYSVDKSTGAKCHPGGGKALGCNTAHFTPLGDYHSQQVGSIRMFNDITSCTGTMNTLIKNWDGQTWTNFPYNKDFVFHYKYYDSSLSVKWKYINSDSMRYNFDCCYQNQLLKIDISCDGVARGCFLLKFKGGGKEVTVRTPNTATTTTPNSKQKQRQTSGEI